MRLTEIRDRFPRRERQQWEVDRILVQEPRANGDETRFAIDLRVGYASMNIRMGAGSSRLGRTTPVADALVAMDAFLEGVEIERLDAWGAQLSNADLVRLLATRWFAGLRVLNLGANRISKQGIDALTKHAVATQLQELTLSYNKVGGALSKAAFPMLESLELIYCGIDDKALPKLGSAPMPQLKRLMLDGAALHTTPGKLIQADRMGDAVPEPQYATKALESFASSPMAARLNALGLGALTIGEPQAKVIGDHFEPLTQLILTSARMDAASVTALVSGKGLAALQELDLRDTFAPNYASNGELQKPAASTAEAMREIARSRFARTLKKLVLDQVVLGLKGVEALLSGSFPHLERVELRDCQLGDDGLAAIAASETQATELLLKGNAIGTRGLRALLDAPLAARLTALELQYNPVGDEGAGLIATSNRLAKLQKLSLGGVGLTDAGAIALARAPVSSQLQVLILIDNRISDLGATAFAEAKLRNLQRLHLGKNCLTGNGVATLRASYGHVALFVDEQDPSKLPPTVVDNSTMRFVEREGVVRPPVAPVPPAIREQFPYPAWVAREGANPDWIYAMSKVGDDYEIAAVEAKTGRVVKSVPAIRTPLLGCIVSRDGQWLAVKAFSDAAYVVSLQDGAATRLGDVLTHQEGGAAFCDGRVVILDCDTDGDWEGRLDVYAYRDGAWTREHALGGFFGARDELVSLAKERMIAVKGRGGLFLCAVRDKELRYLGRLPVNPVDIYDVDGRVFVQIHNRYTYELTNVDEVLDTAFATGATPNTLALGEDVWAV